MRRRWSGLMRGVWRAVLVLVLVGVPFDRAPAATLTYPGAAPCATTLQSCIDGAASGDTIEIASSNAIARMESHKPCNSETRT